MNKKFIYYFIAVVFVGSLPITTNLIRSRLASKPTTQACSADLKMCPDESTVKRILPNCEFALCPTKSSIPTPPPVTVNEVATSTKLATSSLVKKISPKANTPQPKILTPAQTKPTSFLTSLFSSITSSVSSLTTIATSPFKKDTPPSVTSYSPPSSFPPSTYIPSPQQDTSVYKPLPPKDFAGEKYLVKDNNILSNDNKVIYSIPKKVIDAVSTPDQGWTNTTINVVPLGTVPPNAIPLKDIPGKYYLSENSFGDMSKCEFSNKIFILDTFTDTVTLMYEENSSTLSHEDPRACNSEIFLLATENSELILKYHTIGTNTLCDSAWSEPDKTFYLDVTKLSTETMKKYDIPTDLTVTAEQEEDACRAKL